MQDINYDKKNVFFCVDTIVMIVLFFAGDLENEEEILEWLVDQLEKDEIEDVTDEMLDRLIKDGKTVAVLFCKYSADSADNTWSINRC